MRLLFLLNVVYWFFALCSSAHADPATIGALIVGSEIAGTTIFGSVTVGTVVGSIALTAISIGLSLGANYLLAKQQSDPRQDGQVVTREAAQSRRRGYGQYKTGGATMLSEVSAPDGFGSGGSIDLYRVIALHSGEIDSFVNHYFGDKLVFLLGGPDADNGAVAGIGNVGATLYMLVNTRKGVVPETPYGLDSLFPALVDSNFRGDGIASAMIKYGQPPNVENFTVAYPGGIPDYQPVIKASKVWDPRDGDQDKDDPSTWAWTDNPVLIALDFHRHADGLGLSAYDATLFTSAALTEDWGPAADICEETVGGIPRYRCGGSYAIAEEAPADVLAAILATCDGQTYQRSDGAIGIRVGKTVDPTVTITSEHILGYDLQSGDDVVLACNEVTCKYTSSNHGYQETEAQPWRDETDITNRGQVLTKAISLPWVQNHSQARRLMKLAHARFNPAWKGTIFTDLAGLAAINERFIHVTIVEAEGTTLVDEDFEIIPDTLQIDVSPDEGIKVSIGISSLDQSAYDWDEATEAGTEPPIPDDGE